MPEGVDLPSSAAILPVMTRSSSTPVVRRPRQDRSRAAWQRILDAGLELLKEGGYEGFTIAAICERAGVTPPTIYARVRTKDALFLAVFNHGYTELATETEATRARLSGDGAEAIIRAAVGAMVVTTLAHARFLRPVILRAEADLEIGRLTQQARSATAAWFRGVVQAHSMSAPGCSSDRIDACFRTIFMTLIARIVIPSSTDLGRPFSDEAFIADLQTTACRLILTDVAPPLCSSNAG